VFELRVLNLGVKDMILQKVYGEQEEEHLLIFLQEIIQQLCLQSI